MFLQCFNHDHVGNTNTLTMKNLHGELYLFREIDAFRLLITNQIFLIWKKIKNLRCFNHEKKNYISADDIFLLLALKDTRLVGESPMWNITTNTHIIASELLLYITSQETCKKQTWSKYKPTRKTKAKQPGMRMSTRMNFLGSSHYYINHL